jgi:tetratricopeptide (TPR) repeat protein
MFAEARGCLEQAIDCYARTREITTTAALFGAGNAQSILGLTLSLQGYPAQAVRSSIEGLTIACESGYAAAVSIALVNLALLETAMASASVAGAIHVDKAVAHSAKHYSAYEPWARFYSGILRTRRGDPRQGIEIMKAAADEKEFDATLGQTLRLGYLAAAHASVGALEVALGILDEANIPVERTQERLFEAEIHRLRGEVLLGLRLTEDAEAALFRALTVARNQDARMWELRASMSLARLRRSLGQNAEARELLAPIYDWFTEGFDTADLQEASTLLAEIG